MRTHVKKILDELNIKIEILNLELSKEIWYEMDRKELSSYDEEMQVEKMFIGKNGIDLVDELRKLLIIIENNTSNFYSNNSQYLNFLKMYSNINIVKLKRKKIYDYDDIQDKWEQWYYPIIKKIPDIDNTIEILRKQLV